MNPYNTLVEALEACEKNLRVIHEAAGPTPMEMDAPPSFAAWQVASAALEEAKRWEPAPEIEVARPGTGGRWYVAKFARYSTSRPALLLIQKEAPE